MKSGASAKYPTMSIDKICGLPIRDIADKDCALFLWVTTPILSWGFDVMKAWGFNYKTAIYWRKINSLGMGYWFRGQVEVCLLGVRGKVKAFRMQRCNVIESKVGKHSEKPQEMRDIIEQTGLSPRIELFARKHAQGWDVWGNEVESDINIKGV